MRMLLIVPALVLAACGKGTVRPTPEHAAEMIQVPVETYVPIDSELRERCTWKRRCKPSTAIDCAKERAVCLNQYERQFDGIDAVQGKPVPTKREREAAGSAVEPRK